VEVTIKDYASAIKPTWCPGCGDYGILSALKQALVQAGLAPHEVLIVTGIGCGSKLPDYAHVNGFMTLHGRPLPVATGARLANHGLKVITVHGDGDSMGLGMGHFIHTARRNIELVDLIQNNQIYGLTKGQYSPPAITALSPARRQKVRSRRPPTRPRWRWLPEGRSSPAVLPVTPRVWRT